jgi:hypothetical protein
MIAFHFLDEGPAVQRSTDLHTSAASKRIVSGKPTVVRSWTDEDEPSLLELHRLVSGEGDLSNPEFFDWQYRQNPAGRAFLACAQETGGMIVAQSAAIPVPLRIDGKSIIGSFTLNATTHPDYRRLGLFTKCAIKVLEELILARIPYSFTFPSLNTYIGSDQRGYYDLGLTHLLMKLHDAEAFLADRGFSHDWFHLGSMGAWFLKSFQKEPRRLQHVEEVDSFDGIAIEKLREPAKMTLDVSAQWLTWRYARNPCREYRIVVARKSREIVGLAVHRVQKFGLRKWGIIMELMLSAEATVQTVESMMSEIFSENVKAGCSVTLCLVSPGSRKQELLRQCGFWLVPKRLRSKGMGALLYRHNTSPGNDLRMEDIDLSFGMHDDL